MSLSSCTAFASLQASHVDCVVALSCDRQYTVRLPLGSVASATWGTVVRAAMALHLQDHPRRPCLFAGVQVAGVQDLARGGAALPADAAILPVIARLLPAQALHCAALLLGPIYSLSEHLLQLQVGAVVLAARELSALAQVSRRFRRIFMADVLWARISFPIPLWPALGHLGTEEEMWASLRLQQGLTHVGTHRLRWHFHRTSRVKLFYGKILLVQGPPAPLCASAEGLAAPGQVLLRALRGLSSALGARALGCRAVGLNADGLDTGAVNKILVVGGAAAARLMRQLHFVVPVSATAHHFDRRCLPLLPGGRLLGVEPSPAKSRPPGAIVDPGTRVESGHVPEMTFRRLGDPRLTFCQVDPGHRGFDYSSWMALTVGAVGYILVLEAVELPAELDATLRHLLRGSMATTPVLLLLGLPSAAPQHAAPLQQAREAMSRLLPNCPWYVQAFLAQADVGDLRAGHLAGLNWITRVVLSQKTRC